MARPKKNISILSVHKFLNQFDEYTDVPLWIDDVISGSCTIGTGNRSASIALFAYFKIYDYINIENVSRFINLKQKEIEGTSYSERYSYLFMQRLVSCFNALEYHLATRSVKTPESSLQEVLEPSPPVTFVFADGVKYSKSLSIYFY